MKMSAWHLPWGRETVSHGILDINRGCNITCRACYNALPPSFKSLPEIKTELSVLRSRRQLGYVSLVGGEVLLHPKLCEIIRILKHDGLCVQIFTNGLLLDDARLAELRRTGLDIIYVHLDRGQTRPDLPPNPTHEQLRRLWDEKASLIARHGIDVGLTMTAYPGELSDVRDMVDYVVDSPHVNYLLVTMFRDTENIALLQGDIDSGLRGSLVDPARPRNDTLTNWDIIRCLDDELSMRPFAYLGSNKDPDDPRWLSYLVATRRGRDGKVERFCPKASAFEKAFCALSLRLAGKYPMYQRQSAFQLFAQLLLNGITGGDFFGNLKFLLHACRPGGKLGAKRLLFQCPAQVEEDGTLTHCRNCPDAVVKNGGLVPLCISDKVLHQMRGGTIMTEDKFWEIIQESRIASSGCEEQCGKLTKILSKLQALEIIEFDRIFFEKRILAYRWDLWGVAYIINGGCSDDGFEYFRCWLIGQGRENFERAIQDPQSIADLVQEGDVECEDLLYASNYAYKQLTGEEIPPVTGEYPSNPVGEPWDEEDLDQKFPKVYQKFG